MQELPLLSLLVWTPFLGALLVLLSARSGKVSRGLSILSCCASLVELVLILQSFNMRSGLVQFEEKVSWITSLGVFYALGINGVGLALGLCIGLLMLCILVWSRSEKSSVFANMLLAQGCMFGVLVSQDLVLFYLFWELMLLPVFLLLGVHGKSDEGAEEVRAAAFKFFLYTFTGAVLLLAGIIYLSVASYRELGVRSFLVSDLMKLRLPVMSQIAIAFGFIIAFLIKLPGFPFHTWFRQAQVAAPIEGALLFTVLLFQMGLYGLVQFVFPLCPGAWSVVGPVLGCVGVVSIVYGALLAYREKNLRAIVAYSSVSHLGLCALGVASFETLGIVGAVFHAVAHAVSALGILALIGFLEREHGVHDIDKDHGLVYAMPWLAGMFFVTLLGYVALPLTNGFVGELLILTGSFSRFPLLAILATSGAVLVAIYMLSLFRSLFFGPATESCALSGDIGFREWAVIVPVVLLTFYMGVFPGGLTELITPSAEHLKEVVQSRRITRAKLPLRSDAELVGASYSAAEM